MVIEDKSRANKMRSERAGQTRMRPRIIVKARGFQIKWTVALVLQVALIVTAFLVGNNLPPPLPRDRSDLLLVGALGLIVIALTWFLSAYLITARLRAVGSQASLDFTGNFNTFSTAYSIRVGGFVGVALLGVVSVFLFTSLPIQGGFFFVALANTFAHFPSQSRLQALMGMAGTFN